jgi:hypothetical protein
MRSRAPGFSPVSPTSALKYPWERLEIVSSVTSTRWIISLGGKPFTPMVGPQEMGDSVSLLLKVEDKLVTLGH